MKLPVLTLGLTAVGLALPTREQRDDPQIVRLTFHGGPASYSMEFPADGIFRNTSKPILFGLLFLSSSLLSLSPQLLLLYPFLLRLSFTSLLLPKPFHPARFPTPLSSQNRS